MKGLENLYVRPEDERYIEEMKNWYVSDAEKLFFECMSHKIHHESAIANDLIMHEDNNEDGIYIVRVYDSEFIVGRHQADMFAEEVHAMTFCEAMNIPMKQNGLLDEDITLLDWLRKRDYNGVEYDHNYNMM